MSLKIKQHDSAFKYLLPLHRLKKEESGAASLIFSIFAVPLLLTAGAAIDYSRVVAAKTQLQLATDTAALALGSYRSSTQGERQSVAKSQVGSVLNMSKDITNLSVVETEPSAGTYEISSTAIVQTTLMRLASINFTKISAVARVSVNSIGAGQKLELALALDNTGSMANDMDGLRTAAKNLANSVLSAGSSGNVRVSVVPYVATVNPGLTDMQMVDTSGRSPANGTWFSYKWVAYGTEPGCPPVWAGGTPAPLGSSSSGDIRGDASDLINILNPFRKIAQELFGVSSAHAADATPNTVAPIILQTAKSSGTGRTYKYPTGFIPVWKGTAPTGGCDVLANPGIVSNYELFARTRGPSGAAIRWKGCVEARLSKNEITWLKKNSDVIPAGAKAADYDVTDTPPETSDPISLFVPYFWPDEPDLIPATRAYSAPGPYVRASGNFHNNYLADTPPSPTWGWTQELTTVGQTIWKYDGATKSAIIEETPPATYGPNAACPDAVQRLTNDSSLINNKINGLSHWYNGGTVSSEGLMWAWRSLSPNLPYGDGAAYGAPGVKKVIVLMSDGVNGLADNGNTASVNISDYSSYGYLGDTRLREVNGVTSYTKLTSLLDNRLLAACENAKKAGVTIYTVLFSANLTAAGAAQSQSILQQCASSPANAVSASNVASLNTAFGDIATNLTSTKIRLVR